MRDLILNARDFKLEAVEVPEWGCTVHVRSMKAADRARVAAWSADAKTAEATALLPCRLLCLCLCDGEGVRLLGDDDAVALAERDGAVIERLALLAMKLNGLTADAVAAAKKN